MRLPNQRSPARPERIDRLPIRPLGGLLSLALIFFAGCASGTPGTTWLGEIFRTASPAAVPSVAPAATATPTPIPTSVTEETARHAPRKTARQARAASENAGIASKEGGSAAAAQASKQGAGIGNRIEGTGQSSADVSLESSPAAPALSTPAATLGNHGTPAPSPSVALSDAGGAQVPRNGPTLSTSGLESPGPPESSPAKAAKLIQDVRQDGAADRSHESVG